MRAYSLPTNKRTLGKRPLSPIRSSSSSSLSADSSGLSPGPSSQLVVTPLTRPRRPGLTSAGRSGKLRPSSDRTRRPRLRYTHCWVWEPTPLRRCRRSCRRQTRRRHRRRQWSPKWCTKFGGSANEGRIAMVENSPFSRKQST